MNYVIHRKYLEIKHPTTLQDLADIGLWGGLLTSKPHLRVSFFKIFLAACLRGQTERTGAKIDQTATNQLTIPKNSKRRDVLTGKPKEGVIKQARGNQSVEVITSLWAQKVGKGNRFDLGAAPWLDAGVESRPIAAKETVVGWLTRLIE